MLKWFSNDESGPNQAALESQEGSSSQSMAEVSDQLVQTQQLVAQLKELIREKDSNLQAKDEQLKTEKGSFEARLSKLKLQNKAKVTSLNAQLEDLKKQLAVSGGKVEIKKSGGDGDQEHASASRGKILLLKKKAEELEQQLLQKEAELTVKTKELEAQRQRGMEMDAMLSEKNRKLAEKEAYIIDLQMTVGGDITTQTHQPQVVERKSAGEPASMQELQLLVQHLTKKIGESEERYSLLQEQTESLKELLVNEKAQFEKRENMYKENIQTFKDIILQKDYKLTEVNQMHEQELFRLAAKSDASADLEQLLKALKQKLHEKEEVLLGKTQVINVLQGEVDAKDQQIKDLGEKMQWLHVEKDNMQSKLDAERHVMRAQLRDLMQKHEEELQRVAEKHEHEVLEKEQSLHRQMGELRSTPAVQPGEQRSKDINTDSLVDMEAAKKLSELEAQLKVKAEEASKSEAKFLKMKAWSKSRIRQLEDDIRKAQSGCPGPDMNTLQNRITDLEEERQELLCKLDQYDELKTKNDQLIAKLVAYEEQQRKMQADLEQVTKRAASQTSESGSVDELQSQVLEWQDMVLEAEAGREQARGEKAALAIRMSHIEEEREVLVSRQQELEEELAQARGLRQQKGKKLAVASSRSLQEDFEFEKQTYPDPKNALESTASTEGENMGGWWPEYRTSDAGLRSVVEELELERNQLQEQIVGLEERCQDLEDRLQMQARIESLQTETERLQAQLAGLRSQQSRETENHQLLVASLNEQLKGLSETQECLETSLMEKEHTLAKASEKLEFIDNLTDALKEKENQYKEVTEKLLQAEHNLSEVTKKCSSYEKQCSDLKKSVADLTQKTSMLKDKAQKQETTIVSLQNDLEQTNDELDKLNSTHLEERAQLIHDLQSCEREIDSLKDILADKDKEICVLSNSMTEYSEQIFELKRDIKLKEEDLVRMETTLTKTEREAQVMRDSQSSDQQALNTKITQLTEQLKVAESELDKVKEETNLKTKEAEELLKQVQKDDQNIKNLCGEIQKLTVNHQSHLLECESQISSLKDQVTITSLKLQDSESHLSQTNVSIEKLEVRLQDKEKTYEKELKCLKEECNQLIAEAVKAEEKIKNLSEKLENISISQEEAENEQVNLNQKLKARDSDNERLQQALQAKSESISRLEMDVKFLESANQQLKAAFEKKEEELSKQKKLIEDLNERISITYDEHASLKSQFANLVEENKKLQQEIAYKDENKIALAEQLNSKMSVYELQHSESQKTIEGLQKDKENLLLRNEELGKVLEQNKISMSGMLLEKTNECSRLAKLVSESKENVTQLHDQVSHLNAQLEEARGSLTEKEKMILDKNAHCEMQQSQLEQTVTTLKAGLMEKESLLHQGSVEVNSLQNEIMLHKQLTTQLQAENESLQMENLRLSQSLEEKEANLRSYSQEYEKFLNEYNKMTETTVSMSSQIEENNKTILMLESANVDIKKTLETQVADNIKVQEQLSQNQTEVKGLQNHLQALNEENQQLHVALQKEKEELVEQKKLVTDLNERNGMTSEQISENRKIIEILLKEKEDLTIKIEELKHTEQHKTFLSESLFEKTNECSLLTQLLSESKESVAGLHNHVALLNAEIEELKVKVSEKDQMISDKNSNQEQLQETLSLLQEQGIALKAGLMEKDALVQQRDVEVRSLRTEILKQKECCSQIEEDRKSALDKHISDNCMLRETLSQNQTKLIELHNSLQALNEENDKIKTEYHNLEAEASKTAQEIVVLQSELSKQKNEVVSLTKKLRALEEENEQMHLSLQQKTESVNQQEMFIKQLKDQLEQGKSQMDTISELQSQIQFMQKTMQDKERSSQEKETQLKQFKEKAVTASDALTTQISANIETISNLQAEIKSLLEKNKELNISIAEKESHLKNKVDDYLSLRAKYSELEDMDLQLREKVDSLSLESVQLKKMLKEKEETLIEIQSTSLANSDILNINYKTKDAECETLKQQVFMLQEDVSKLKDNLCAQSSEIAKLQETLAEKEATALEQIKALQNLQSKADEAALFKTQFAESTELVSELQRQVQENSLEYGRLNEHAQEKKSALSDLQQKYAIHLEELSQKNEEINNLNKLLTDSKDSNKTAENTVDVLSSEMALLREELQHIQASHAELSKQKEEALTTHQVHASNLMVEIEGLRSQHLQVAAQVNALTQNLEQRELALYEINNQYAVQVKRGEHLLSENQKIREENKKLREESSVNKDLQRQLDAAISEKDFQKAITEKEDLCKSYSNQLQMLKEEFELQHQQHLGSMSEAMEKMMTEKEHLQLQLKEVGSLKSENADLEKALQEAQAYRWQTERDINTYQVELAELKSERNKLMSEHHSLKQPVVAMAEKNSAPLAKNSSGEQLPLLLTQRRQLESDLQRCLQEIHQRDLRFQQVNAQLLQTVEEKMGLASQLKTTSQTLRDTQLNLGDLQNRCYWLESQIQTFPGQGHAHGAVAPEVPPGAPQERSITEVAMDTPQASELRSRLVEVEQQLVSTQHDLTQLAESLTEERARRQVAEEALGLAEERVKSMNASISRTSQGEFTIHLESDDEREALIIDPSENVVTRKMKGGVLSCKRWLRGRSLYCSKLLTSRAKSRYLFLAYLLTLHVIVFMCFTGTL
ncbi:golgin subfamily B member 1-like isoform X2 [Brienomyrus brachyistius]|uniref:golgin subfamily B member 1-like isoform X2 n=1 Tax=Brienomyrus brachyistius TaxID=42636 RepID=UPI0020B40FF4|nr:golgin subfamily B member 1-like isoform X2 [Brienomyrus brachyistius]